MNTIRKEINRTIIIRIILTITALVIITISYNLYRIDQYALINRLDFFSFNMSSFIPFLFPLFTVIIFAQPFSNEFTNDFIFYTHSRIDLKDYIHNKLVTNSFVVFVSFFATIFLIFIFSYYIEPLFDLVTYQPEQLIGLSTQEVLRYEESMFTFSQLVTYSPLLMGVIYSFWVGLNAVVYSTMAILTLLLIENTFIALSIPFLFYHISSFVVAVLGFENFLFDATIFPFNIEQQSLITIFPPFVIVVALNMWLYWLFIKRLNHK